MPFLNPSYESGICHDLIRQRGQFSASCGWHILPLRVVNYRFFRGIQQHCKILNMESSVKHNASVNEEDSPKKHSHSSLSHKFIFSRKEASVVCNHLDETELTREKQYCSNSLSVNLTFLWHIAVSAAQSSLAIAFIAFLFSRKSLPLTSSALGLPLASISSSTPSSPFSLKNKTRYSNLNTTNASEDKISTEREKEEDIFGGDEVQDEFSPEKTPRILQLDEESIRLERPTVPSTVDPIHVKTLETLQLLGILERELNPEGICTRREFARWMVYASTILGRSTSDRVFPAVFVEGLTELAFDDVFPDDSDFPFIQGLAEAGLIPSRLSRLDVGAPFSSRENWFHPDSPLTRQDMILWKTNLDIKALPKVTGEVVRRVSAFIDVEKISKDCLPSIAFDLSSGEESIINTAFGYTRRFEPFKAVTHAQAAYALGCGNFAVKIGGEIERRESEIIAEEVEAKNSAHMAAVEAIAQEKVGEERRLRLEAEKLLGEALEKIERMRIAREEEQSLIKSSKESIDEEREILRNLREQTESNLKALTSSREEIEREKERLTEQRKAAEAHSLALEEAKLQMEVEKQSLGIAKAWAEQEASRAREESRQLRALRRRIRSHQIEASTKLTPGVTTSESVIMQEEKEVNSGEALSSTVVPSTAAAISLGDLLSDFFEWIQIIVAAFARMFSSVIISLKSGVVISQKRMIALFRKELFKLKAGLYRWH